MGIFFSYGSFDRKNPMAKTTGAIILAAGFSRRFGNQKLIQKLSNGNSVLKQTLERMQAAIPNIEIVTTPELSAYLTPQTCGINIFSNASQGIGATPVSYTHLTLPTKRIV